MEPEIDTNKKDNVNHPNHYAGQGKVECIDFIASVVNKYPGILAGDLQNVCKYTWRSHEKNGKEDIQKAVWYFAHAEKTWNGLQPEVKGLVKAFSRNPIIQTPHAEEIQKDGLKEITSTMGKAETELYKMVIVGLNNFTDDYLRQKAQFALETWSKSYEKFVDKKKDKNMACTMTQKRIVGIHREPKHTNLER